MFVHDDVPLKYVLLYQYGGMGSNKVVVDYSNSALEKRYFDKNGIHFKELNTYRKYLFFPSHHSLLFFD